MSNLRSKRFHFIVDFLTKSGNPWNLSPPPPAKLCCHLHCMRCQLPPSTLVNVCRILSFKGSDWDLTNRAANVVAHLAFSTACLPMSHDVMALGSRRCAYQSKWRSAVTTGSHRDYSCGFQSVGRRSAERQNLSGTCRIAMATPRWP